VADDHILQAHLDKSAVDLLLYAVSFSLDKWPGGDPVQQEGLRNLRTMLFRMHLEFQMNSDE
jgi:hypothetical protein